MEKTSKLITNSDWTRQSITMMADNTIQERAFLGLDILQRAINILRVHSRVFLLCFRRWHNCTVLQSCNKISLQNELARQSKFCFLLVPFSHPF